MLVQRVVMPLTGALSWTVLDDSGELVEPVESYLAYLSALERSPNTQRAYDQLEVVVRVPVSGAEGLEPGRCE